MNMNNLSWITLYPELYREERHLVEKQYPSLKFCRAAYDVGRIVYHGELDVHDSAGVTKHRIVLHYPALFPYHPPIVTPVKTLPGNEPHSGWVIEPMIISARHQMAGGNLCLVESDPFRGSPEITRGIDVLRKARAWFFGVKSGHNPYDSLEADLQAHLNKGGDILIGPEFYSNELHKGGYFYAARILEMPMINIGRFVALAYSSDFEDVAKFKDCRASLERPFPWIQSNIWDVAQQLSVDNVAFRDLVASTMVMVGS
jgi:hypothetical protein